MTQSWNATEAPRGDFEVISEWLDAQTELARLKNLEASLRKQVIERRFKNHKVSGTENSPLENGFKLKAVFKQNYNLKAADEVDKALSKIEQLGEEGAFIAKRLIKWKPELSLTEYKDLDPKYKKIVDTVLTITDASPSLEMVVPKDVPK